MNELLCSIQASYSKIWVHSVSP